MNKILQIILLIVFISLNVNAQSWNWVNTIGTPGSDKVINVRSDASSNVIVSGYFSEDVNLGNGVILTRTTTGGSSKEAFVAKYDSNGICQWAKSAGGWFDDRVLGMDLDNDGNVYITGTCWFSIQMGPFYVNDPTGSSCCDQTFVAKLDKNGNWIWTNMAGGFGDVPKPAKKEDVKPKNAPVVKSIPLTASAIKAGVDQNTWNNMDEQQKKLFP